MSEQTWVIGQEKAIALLGRRPSSPFPFCPCWTGSGVELRLCCGYLSAELEISPQASFHSLWILVCIDGAPVARFPLAPGRRSYTILSGMDPAVPHTVSILRDTQPIEGFPVTTSLIMHTLSSDGQLLALPEKSMTIEFIGDSLTTGEGIVGPRDAMEWQSVWMSSLNYSHMVCQALSARPRIISQSGWGVYTSWDNNPQCVLSRIYEQLCAFSGSAPYDFTQEPADLVVINLGTNDSGALDRIEDQAGKRQRRREIQTAAENFLRQLRRCNPSARILWVYGMCGHPLSAVLRRAVDTIRKEGDLAVDYLPLPSCPPGWNGSRLHPGLRNHQAVAERIVSWVQQNMSGQETPKPRQSV